MLTGSVRKRGGFFQEKKTISWYILSRTKFYYELLPKIIYSCDVYKKLFSLSLQKRGSFMRVFAEIQMKFV